MRHRRSRPRSLRRTGARPQGRRRGHRELLSCFDDVWLRALYECDDLVTFRPRDSKRLQGGIEVPPKCRPIAFTDVHPTMGGLHISSCVVQGTACTRTQKVNQELLFPLYAILSSMLPEASQLRIRL